MAGTAPLGCLGGGGVSRSSCCGSADSGPRSIAYDYFWTEPYYSFAILDAQDILTVLLLVIVGAAIEQLSWWGGRQKAVADQRLDYFTALRSAAAPIPTGAPAPTLDAMSNIVRTALDADSCQL